MIAPVAAPGRGGHRRRVVAVTIAPTRLEPTMLTALAIDNYRSLRELIVPLGPLNMVTGPNGSGKSNLYRALRLLADTAQGSLIRALAREGGLQSTLWAGPESISRAARRGEHAVEGTRRKGPVALRLGFAGDEFGYSIELGLPGPGSSAFALDPQIKRECIWAGPLWRPSTLLVDRRGPLVRARRDDGEWLTLAQHLPSFDSMIADCADPQNAPEMVRLRDEIRSWRFYDHFRSDADAPARFPQVGTHTPVLGHDGADLAAAIQTIREIGEPDLLERAVDDAFPGAQLSVTQAEGRFELEMRQPGLLRPLKAGELSDGTLRYLLWIAALLTPRPPALMVLNEPETSLHPGLLPALGRLIALAAQRTQLFVVSHAMRLIAAVEGEPQCHSIALDKEFSETRILGSRAVDAPAWHWPAR